MVAISVIIVNFNAGAHLARCLGALARQSFADFEAIVADNASRDDSLAGARAAIGDDPRFRFVENGANLGFAAGNNRAAETARGTWLAFLNPDAFAEPGWLANLMAAAERNPRCSFFGSTQLRDADPTRLDGAGDAYFAPGLPWRGLHGAPLASLPDHDSETFSACAAAGFMRADLFRKLRGFDETFFCYCEDVDLGFRARLLGEICIQVRPAIVRHVGGASSGGSVARYYGTRNLVWTFWKNMPAPLLAILALPHLAILLFLLLRALPRGDGATVARALTDAFTGLPAILRRRTPCRASLAAITRALSWNPQRYVARAADLQRIE